MRKSKEVTITAPGRDLGKVFVVTELPARQAEAWAMRAMSAMAKSGVLIPDDIASGGILAFAMVGLKAFMAAPWADVGPLLDELMGCVQIKMPAATRALVDDDIEEIATFVKLRDEVLELHVGFSLAAVLLGAVAATQTADTSNTQTSADQPELSSLAV